MAERWGKTVYRENGSVVSVENPCVHDAETSLDDGSRGLPDEGMAPDDNTHPGSDADRKRKIGGGAGEVE